MMRPYGWIHSSTRIVSRGSAEPSRDPENMPPQQIIGADNLKCLPRTQYLMTLHQSWINLNSLDGVHHSFQKLAPTDWQRKAAEVTMTQVQMCPVNFPYSLPIQDFWVPSVYPRRYPKSKSPIHRDQGCPLSSLLGGAPPDLSHAEDPPNVCFRFLSL